MESRKLVAVQRRNGFIGYLFAYSNEAEHVRSVPTTNRAFFDRATSIQIKAVLTQPTVLK